MLRMSDVGLATRHRVTHPVAAPVAAGGLLLAGCAALAVVDPSGGPTICPFKLLTGLDCPGCGGTRAAHQLFTGHLGAAADLNVLALVGIPLVLAALFVSLTAAFGGPRWRSFTFSSTWTRVALVVVAVFWVVRNLPGAPFDWLGTGT
jgi:hypothetical protein